jgi:Protein of unknown function (DUF3606)
MLRPRFRSATRQARRDQLERGETMDSVTEVPESEDQITTNEEAEIQYWTQRFGVNRHQLINAIQLVGTASKDVEKFLSTGNKPEAA